jgi:hypothetical protein
MRFGIIRKVADALSVNRKPSAPEETGALIADLKALETSLAARLVDMSDDRRTQITNTAIHILRTKNAGWKAEAEVRRIAGVRGIKTVFTFLPSATKQANAEWLDRKLKCGAFSGSGSEAKFTPRFVVSKPHLMRPTRPATRTAGARTSDPSQ